MLRFQIEIQDPRTHLLSVTLELDRTDFLPDEVPTLFMPVWTPGSYLVREFARHLEGFEAVDADTATPIHWCKTSKNRFALTVGPGVSRLRVSYRVYASDLTVRTADVSEDHAFWNGACVLVWPVGQRHTEAMVDLRLPGEWDFSCALMTHGGAGIWHLRPATLDELVDSPCLAGRLHRESFTVLGKTHEFISDGLGGLSLPPQLVPDTTRIIEQAALVFGGELPYDRYEFLCLFTDQGRGGLEHRDCTVLLAPRTTFWPQKSYEDFMGLVAHEFFHLWNVKRLRPVDLWEVDLEEETYTSLLWVAEGFTSYYDDLLCLRAGILSPTRYLELIGNTITDVLRTPGRLIHALSQASHDAWIKYYRPDENSRNSSQSYYLSGALAALCLDLEIRRSTSGARSLDDAMRALWQNTYQAGRGFTKEDVVQALSGAAGKDLGPTVDNLVDGPFDPDLGAVLQPFGVLLERRTETSPPSLGLQWRGDGMVVGSVLADGAAAAAGLASGDEVLALAGHRTNTPKAFQSLYDQLGKAKREISVLISRRGLVLERVLPLPPSTQGEVKLTIDGSATPGQNALREGWLGIGSGAARRA